MQTARQPCHRAHRLAGNRPLKCGPISGTSLKGYINQCVDVIRGTEKRGMNERTKQIEEIILAAVPDAQVIVRDPNNDGAHFEATVISQSFEGMRLVEQHRIVMQSLKKAFTGDVHALSLKTCTPDEWANTQSEFDRTK